MSGGSYNYAYSHIGDIDHWASTLEGMAADCRDWAKKIQTKVLSKDAPVTVEERARLASHAERLERAARLVREAHAEVERLEDLMHDVEWVRSGDYAVDELLRPYEPRRR